MSGGMATNAMTLALRIVATRRSYRLPRIALRSWPVVPLPLERILVGFVDFGIDLLLLIGPRRHRTLLFFFLRISGRGQ